MSSGTGGLGLAVSFAACEGNGVIEALCQARHAPSPLLTQSGHSAPVEDRILNAVRQARYDPGGPGCCMTCGAEAKGVDPKASQLKCEVGGSTTVYGAVQLCLLQVGPGFRPTQPRQLFLIGQLVLPPFNVVQPQRTPLVAPEGEGRMLGDEPAAWRHGSPPYLTVLVQASCGASARS